MSRNKCTAKAYSKKILIQKLMGVAFLILSAVLVLVELSGQPSEVHDCTALLFLVPMALYLIFSKCEIIDIGD